MPEYIDNYGNKIVSNFSDEEAYIICKRLEGSFAQKIAAYPLVKLSKEQIKWLHIYAGKRCQTPEIVSDALTSEALPGKYASIVQFMNIGLKNIGSASSVTIMLRMSKEGGEWLKIRKSKTNKVIFVNGKEYGRNYGMIFPNGSWKANNELKGNSYRAGWVTTLLDELAENPAACVAKHGRATGRCCFCMLELTDERSLRAGYGPICARRFGLEWGG